jgi:hypothetical protein
MTASPFEISIDGKPRTYRDRKVMADEAAAVLRRRHPNSDVVARDLRAPSYRPHSSSTSRRTAADVGFFDLSQCGERARALALRACRRRFEQAARQVAAAWFRWSIPPYCQKSDPLNTVSTFARNLAPKTDIVCATAPLLLLRTVPGGDISEGDGPCPRICVSQSSPP